MIASADRLFFNKNIEIEIYFSIVIIFFSFFKSRTSSSDLLTVTYRHPQESCRARALGRKEANYSPPVKYPVENIHFVVHENFISEKRHMVTFSRILHIHKPHYRLTCLWTNFLKSAHIVHLTNLLVSRAG